MDNDQNISHVCCYTPKPQAFRFTLDILVKCVLYCHESQWLKTGFGLVTGFINLLQVVTTANYYTVIALHNLQSLHPNLFSPSALVLTGL
jgi:hypothetical protein